MYGDFSRDSFDPSKHYTRVLMQQGRPLTDADWNEQAAILLYEQRAIVQQLIDWHGTFDRGFSIQTGISAALLSASPRLTAGNYFIHGLRAEALDIPDTPGQLVLRPVPDVSDLTNRRLLYLVLWENSISALSTPYIAEPALVGYDTSTRGQLAWALKVQKLTDANDPEIPDELSLIRCIYGATSDKGDVGKLAVQIKRGTNDTNNVDSHQTSACAVTQQSVGMPDQLYRVEIHRSGIAIPAEIQSGNSKYPIATFKWSRDNASRLAKLTYAKPSQDPTGLPTFAPIVGPYDVQMLRDSGPKGFPTDSWLELCDGSGLWRQKSDSLLKVSPSGGSGKLTLADDIFPELADASVAASSSPMTGYPTLLLREWNQTGRAIKRAAAAGATVPANDSDVSKTSLVDSSPGSTTSTITDVSKTGGMVLGSDNAALLFADSTWMTLENGVQIRFEGNCFLKGDYWLIRTTRDGHAFVFSSREGGAQLGHRPYHFAPIGTLQLKPSGEIGPVKKQYRRQYKPLGFELVANATLPGPAFDAQPGLEPPAHRNGDQTVPPPHIIEGAPVLENTGGILSSAGKRALKRFASSPTGVTRRIPARYLNHVTQSASLKRWLRTALVSEIHEPTFEQFLDKVTRSIPVSDSELVLLEAEAREVYGLATTLRQVVATGGGLRQLIA